MRRRSIAIAEREAATTLTRRDAMASAWTVLSAAKDLGDLEAHRCALAVIDAMLNGKRPRLADEQTIKNYFC